MQVHHILDQKSDFKGEKRRQALCRFFLEFHVEFLCDKFCKPIPDRQVDSTDRPSPPPPWGRCCFWNRPGGRGGCWWPTGQQPRPGDEGRCAGPAGTQKPRGINTASVGAICSSALLWSWLKLIVCMKHCGGRMSNPPHDFENSRLQGYNNKQDGAIVRQWEAAGCRPISEHWLGAKNVNYLDRRYKFTVSRTFMLKSLWRQLIFEGRRSNDLRTFLMMNNLKPGVYR